MDATNLSPARLRAILGMMAVSLMAVISAVSGLNMAIPSMATATGATLTELQWIVDACTVVFAGLLLIAGALGDRFGRKGILQFGLSVFALAAAVAFFATDPAQLVWSRAVMGLAAACVMPTTLSVITTVFPPEQRPRAVGVWVGIAAGGGVVGILAAAILLQFFSWNSFFAFNALLAVIALVGSSLIVPRSKMADAHPLDVVGGLLSLVAVGGVVFGIIEGPSRGWGDAWTVTALVLGVGASVGFVFWELAQKYPLLDPRLFRVRGFSAGSLSITVQFFAAFGFFFVGLQYLQFVAGLTPLVSALCILPMIAVVIPLSRVTATVAARVGFGRISPLGLTLMAAAFVVMSLMGTELVYWHLLIGLLLFGAGMGLAGPPATTAIISSLGREKQGVASAMNDISREVGSALGIAVLGSVLNQVYIDQFTPKIPSVIPTNAVQAFTSSIAWVNSDDATKRLGPLAAQMIRDAKQAYMSGIRGAFWLAAAALIVAAVFVAVRAPRVGVTQVQE